MPSLKDLTAAKDELSSRLLRGKPAGRAQAMAAALTIAGARKNAGRHVFGVGVARKIVNGKKTNTLCVRVYVVQKLASSAIPPAARLPASVDGVPTDVVEALPPRFHQSDSCTLERASRVRPMVGGISAAHYAVNMTTLGCFCRSTRTRDAGRVYMLSCNHAFANMNNGQIGDRILQASPGDGGGGSADGDVAGKLARFVPLNLDGSTPNYVDAAIAEIETSYQNEICTIGPLRGIKSATVGMLVRKHGRKTGYSEGVVEGLDFDWTIPYTSTVFVHMTNQLYIVPAPGYARFALPGDSGSVVVAKSAPYAVGLYFSGADDGSYGIANPIRAVCHKLKIKIP